METIEDLINGLKWGSKDIKEESAKKIAGLGEPAVDYLLPLLSHQDHSIRTMAALILCEIGDKRLLDQFIEFTKDDSNELRKKAIVAIGNIGDSRGIDVLIDLFNDRDVHIRLSAIDALIKIGSNSIEKLIKALEHQSETVRESAAYALGKIMDVNAIPRLLPLFSDKNIYVRIAAAHAISCKGTVALKVLIDLLKDQNEAVREASTYALGEIGDEKTVPYIIEMLSDKDSFVKISAARALGRLRDERAVEPLIRLTKDKNMFVRMAAARALGKIGDERVVEPLLRLLSEENAFVSLSAANAFGELGKEVIEPLLKCLANTDPVIRKSAALALGRLGDERAIIPLILTLWDENEDVTSSVEIALNTIDSFWFTRDEIRQYIPYFSEALKKGGKHVKLCVIGILEKIGEVGLEKEKIETILKNYIKDEDKNIRLNAALALEKVRKKGA